MFMVLRVLKSAYQGNFANLIFCGTKHTQL